MKKKKKKKKKTGKKIHAAEYMRAQF